MTGIKDMFGLRSSWMREGTFAVKKVHGGLLYCEQNRQYLVDVVEGNGYSIVVENMGDVDESLGRIPMNDKMRIAKNMRSVLLKNGFDVDIIFEHHIVRDFP